MSQIIHFIQLRCISCMDSRKMSCESCAPPRLSVFYTASEYGSTIVMRFSLLRGTAAAHIKQTNKMPSPDSSAVIRASVSIKASCWNLLVNAPTQRWLRIMKRGGKPELKFHRLTLHTPPSRGEDTDDDAAGYDTHVGIRRIYLFWLIGLIKWVNSHPSDSMRWVLCANLIW